MLLLKNIRLLRTLFVLTVFILFLASCKNKKEIASTNTPKNNTSATTPKKNETSVKSSYIVDKYATQLKVDKKDIKDEKLYTFIDEWYAAPYKYGSAEKTGTDCSGFANKLYESVYGKKIARSSKEIYATSKEIELKNLREGDFVFFKIESKNISHVGVYLQNNKFVHASTKKGVIINDLDEAYYKKYFFAGGRIK